VEEDGHLLPSGGVVRFGVYILSAGRPRRQYTYNYLPDRWRDIARIVVQDREVALYREALPEARLLVLPSFIRKVNTTRQWLVENAREPRLVMLDDDLEFAVRRNDEPGKFLSLGLYPQHFDTMFEWLYESLGEYAHAGLIAREGAHLIFSDVVVGRMMRVLGYDRKRLLRSGARFDALEFMEDFHVTLSLLRSGLPNVLCARYSQGQRGSDVSGGCSAYRTPDTHARAARDLHRLHPEFVKLVTKKTDKAWGGLERTDVQVSWKKAYESSL
jgi:hypothetical protein